MKDALFILHGPYNIVLYLKKNQHNLQGDKIEMPENLNFQKIISQFKSLEAQLNNSEKEKLRTEMLSYLLFNDNTGTSSNPGNQPEIHKGLSNEELELIKKLAAGIDLLNRIKNGNSSNQ